MGIKLGTLDIDAFKVGSTDVDAIYLGTTLIYSGGTPPTLQWVEFNYGDSISGLDIYGISGGCENINYTFYSSMEDEPFFSDLSRNKVEFWVKDSQMNLCYNEIFDADSSVELIFSEVGCADYITWESSYTVQQALSTFKLLMCSGGTPPTPSYDTEYLTFVATKSGTFTFTPQNSNVISYSTDNGTTWTEGNSVSVNANDKVLWKGTMSPATNSGIGTFSSTGQFEVEGNIMSLLYGDNFSGQTSLNGKKYVFGYLFNGCTGLTSAENMILPATTLEQYCYQYMFTSCTNLTTAPQLPATTLASNCYSFMFFGCTSLTTAPELPATTLAFSCYYNMFWNCTNLTTAPVLSATTLAQYCYYRMFIGCTRLNSITCLATNISASNCTNTWVQSVAASGTFTKAASMNDWTTGVNGIPSGWTVQDYSS